MKSFLLSAVIGACAFTTPAAADTLPTIYGSVIFGHQWESMSDVPYGMYSIPADNGKAVSLMQRSNDLKANGGGVYVDGRYYLVDFTPFNIDHTVAFRVYDADNDWKLLSEKRIKTYSSVASDLTYNPADDKIYGCFNDESLTDKFFFGTLNPITGFSSKIADLNEELVAIASTKEGKLYGISIMGILYSINKTTGQLTEIGKTGKNVKYAQSATFDYPSGRMYWAMTPHYTDESPEICEVNLTTGEATTLTQVPERYEFTGIFTKNSYAADKAPTKVAALNGNFANGSLNGNVSFSFPKTTMDGSKLSGNVSYLLQVDDEQPLTGSGNAGDSMKRSLSLTRGMHTLKVAAKNSVGRGPWSYCDMWAGTDVVNVDGVTAYKSADNEVTVLWLAPEGSVHGGYYNPNDITYTVTRQPDGAKVYEGKATECKDVKVDALQYDNYTYEVVAKTGGFNGDTIRTEAITLGKHLFLPYVQNFNSENAANTMTVEDTNDDGYSWEFDYDCMVYDGSEAENDANDWLITPAFIMKKDSVYQVSIDAHVNKDYIEKLEVAAGPKAEGKSLTQTIIPTTTLTSTEFQTLSNIFIPKQDGECHIGIHAVSSTNDGDVIYIDNLRVNTIGSIKAPNGVTELSAKSVGSERKVEIHFKAPVTDISGNALKENLKTIVVRNQATNNIVKSFSNVAPGEDCDFEDTPTSDGNITYTVTAQNSYGYGFTNTASTYVGLDVPNVVTNMKISGDDDGNVSATWDAPTKGVEGGAIDSNSLKYNVSNLNGSSMRSTIVSSPSYNEQITFNDTPQRLMWYVVSAQTKQGTGPEVSTDTIFVGKPYNLPFVESFKGRGMQNGPWCNKNSEEAEWSIMQYGTYADPVDSDHGLLSFYTVSPGSKAEFIGPKVSLKGSQNPTLKFYVWQMKRTVHTLDVQIVTPDGKHHSLDKFVPNNTEREGNDGEWKTYKYDLSDYSSSEYVQLCLNATGGNMQNLASIVPLYVDNISITDPINHNLAMGDLSTETKKAEVGDEITFHTSVKNIGAEDASDFKVSLYRDGKRVYSKNCQQLALGESLDVELKDVPNSDAKLSSRYEAKAEWDDDQDTSDNTSKQVVVTIVPGKPYIDVVYANNSGDQSAVELSWEKPLNIDADTKAETVTEDFEKYVPFTIDHFGEWTLFDGDKQTTMGIQDGSGDFIQYDNVESPMAFQIFNPSAISLSEFYYPTHSGKQVAATFSTGRYTANDDWLISPEVDGAQTINFWACSPDNSYYGTQEKLEVLYSTSGTATSDFKKIGSTISVPGSWKQFTANLPEGTRYFALHCISQDQYILFLDDITFRKAARNFSLLGYNVYRNGELITPTPVSQTTYIDNAGDKSYSYKVSAVYNTGESRLTTAVWGDPTAISGAFADDSAEATTVYDVAGRRLSHVDKPVKGVYIVKKGSKTKKILIK